MADNLPNVNLPSDVWVDLYDTTGINIGIQLEVQNVGAADVQLTARATTPPDDSDAFNIVSGRNVLARNEEGDVGAWARSRSAAGKLAVKVAT